MPSSETQADVLFRGDDPSGTWSNIATDDSCHGNDFTAGADWVYITGASADVFNLLTRFTVDVRFAAASTDTGNLYRRSNSFNIEKHALRVLSATGNMRIVINGSSTDFTFATWPSSGTDEMVLSIAMEPNPKTTGASDAYRTEYQLYNIDLDTLEIFVHEHAQIDTTAGGTIIFGNGATGSSSSPYSNDVFECRISAAFHTTVEQWETYVDNEAPTNTEETRLEIAMPDPADVDLGGDGQFVGPIFLLGAKSVRESDLLLAGPIINEVIHTSEFLDSGDTPATTWAWEVETGVYAYFQYMWRRPVPRTVNRIRIRAHIQTDATAAPAAWTFYVWSMSQPGPHWRPTTSPSDMRIFQQSVTIPARDDGNADTGGAWADLGRMKIARDLEDYTYFAIGADPISATQDWRCRAVNVDPVLFIDTTEAPGESAGG